eukprot:CAMPEP_0170604364 /NCGR_PEP_ID=MMETSP0224-20130122/19383_1 /TAXON_ID=285029 /ORGANISM="Togula jolla, Strain CCCM 725" /LENGTH=505 /DNA_ID=CAMNT_0010929261 /DNA_START=54 /DNA_END=1571 /DNA_ORIENTATION=+
MEDTTAAGLSKSAKKRAAKKAREAEGEVAAAPAPAATANKENKPNAKAAEAPGVKAKAKAKAEPKAAAAPEPKAKAAAAPAAAKAKAKGEAKAPEKAAEKPAEKPAAKAAAKGEAKAAAKSKAKAKAKSAPQEAAPPPKKEEPEFLVEIDDGSRADEWETATGLTKKQQKRKDRLEEEKQLEKAQTTVSGKSIPGLGPVVQQGRIPGMPEAKAKAGAKGVSQAVTTVGAALLPAQAEAAPTTSNSTMATVNVPESKIGIVIGPKGAKIKMIQEKTGVTRIDTSGEVFTITGPKEAVAQAETAIKDLITKGYTSLAFDDFSENYVSVAVAYFPDIIGKQGAVIRKLKEELGVEVNIPEVPKNVLPTKKFRVSIAGSSQSVEKTKTIINDIMMYYHHPVTHPDQVHEEVDVPEWSFRYLIGKGGSEMRHIQNNFKVRVYVPREASVNQKVVIVGEKDGVDRAKAYVDKLLWNAENAAQGRNRSDGADDGWGEEEPEEEWMQQYMVKR